MLLVDRNGSGGAHAVMPRSEAELARACKRTNPHPTPPRFAAAVSSGLSAQRKVRQKHPERQKDPAAPPLFGLPLVVF